MAVRSVSIISIFGFSIWESQIRTNQLWMLFWHDVGFQCARVSAPRKHDEVSEIDRTCLIRPHLCYLCVIIIHLTISIFLSVQHVIYVYTYIYIYITYNICVYIYIYIWYTCTITRQRRRPPRPGGGPAEARRRPGRRARGATIVKK